MVMNKNSERNGGDSTAARPRRLFYGWYMVAAGSAMQFLQAGLMTQSFGAYVAVLQAERGWSKTALSGHDPLILAARGVADPQRYVAFARPVVLGRRLETEHQQRRRGQRVRKTVQQQRRAERETQRFCLRSCSAAG